MMQLMPLLLVSATLAAMLALFWARFRALGLVGSVRLALIWAVLIVALVLLVRLFKFNYFNIM